MNSYVEWEKYPDKKAKAHKILTSQTFPPNPEYQMGPIPDTNPVLPGDDYKAWHAAIGGELKTVADDSWATVLKEKHPDMLHLLQFPYNGEPPKRLVTSKAVTPNPLHFVRNHGGIPSIDRDKWTLDLDGLVANPKSYTLDDLMDESKFPRLEKLVTIQCSGTRRIEQISLYAGQGDEVPQAPWAEGAIGTAKYVGISLKKVIKDCGGMINGGKHLVRCPGSQAVAISYFSFSGVLYRRYAPETSVKADSSIIVGILWCRDLLQSRSSDELCCECPMVKGQGQRGHSGLGDERRTPPQDPRVSSPSCRARIHRRQERQMAISNQSHRAPNTCPGPKQGVLVLQSADREAQPTTNRRHSDPRDARIFGNHVAMEQTSRHPQRLHQMQRLGILWWWALA